ncbi:MAG: sigma-70 family RNA polymerase sigma factor, partial [Planctomycetaceae bacterium]|nr:sigma-70 family RNA polymerase sigma factor [Planctomycetaceae bacterium]
MTAPPTPKPIESLVDRDLVSRYVRLRDEIAFATLVRRHSSLVLGVCQRVLRHREDVEDAFQATFLVLARDAHRVRKRASLASWLHGVAYRTSLRAAESRHRRIRLVQDVAMISSDANSLADVADRHERQLLDEELEQLPDKYRAPLVLHYLEGKTARQVADELKLSVSTVEGRLKRGRRELQLRLARRGVGLSVAIAAASLTPSLVTAAELDALVSGTIHAGLSYTIGDPAGPLFTHEAARLAAKETIAMTTTTATATLTAALLVPLALSVGNHESPGDHSERQAPTIMTTQFASAESEPIQIAQIEQSGTTPAHGRLLLGVPQTERSAEERRIEQALTEPISLHFNDATLAEVMESVARQCNLNVVLDDAGLRLEGLTVETPITLNVDGINLRSALNLMLKPLKLGFMIEDDVLKVTTLSKIEAAREGIVGSVIGEEGEEPRSAKLMFGVGLEQPRQLHHKEQPPSVQRIEAALESRTQIEFVDMPLSDAMNYLARLHEITILLDERALVDHGIPTDDPVNLIIANARLDSVLNLILRRLDLDYILRDEVLTITTAEVAENTLETRVYNLRHFPNMAGDGIEEILQDSLPGAAWKDKGGEGTVHMIDGGMVVTQTQRVHRQIAELLQQLERHAALGT